MAEEITRQVGGDQNEIPTPSHNIPKLLIDELEKWMEKDDETSHEHEDRLFEKS